jgi:hypothetical protein
LFCDVAVAAVVGRLESPTLREDMHKMHLSLT